MKYKMKNTITRLELTSDELRNLQLNILENLIEFDRICRKYNIKYSIDGGTFLGAVRHKGFIPWDTDADVVIMRDDYTRFLEACKKEMDETSFFLQDYTTDRYYRWGYSRLLLIGTEYVRAGYEHIPAKNGVFLDIFIMDGVPDNVLFRRIHKFLCLGIRKILWSEAGKVVHPNYFMRKWYSVLSLISRDEIFIFQNKLARKCNKNNTELICHMCSPHPKKHSYGFPRKLFEELSEYEFEGKLFYGFSNYDWYLESIYGDYMKLPEEEDRVSHIPCSAIKLFKN
ncbi:LicD family protein [Clostridium chromiireducens]|uniref:LicD family protein n=1 Tax=Clostridium chromiireducens TaxID=225345 RepID=A0A1V4IWS6_9CLOT|nr:LicD family protein [Clostridium chromiireducens]OPJ64512.1 LicD family protein [Clostridium chromiireducens]